jgi:hypothetical protein
VLSSSNGLPARSIFSGGKITSAALVDGKVAVMGGRGISQDDQSWDRGVFAEDVGLENDTKIQVHFQV